MKHYDDQVKLEAKRLYVEESLSPQVIAVALAEEKTFDPSPTKPTISRWANLQSWKEARRNFQYKKYAALSDKSIEQKIMDRISTVLDEGLENQGAADQLSKLISTLNKLTSKKTQIPTMFWMLEQYVLFIKTHYPDLLCERQVDSVRAFKDHLLDMLSDTD